MTLCVLLGLNANNKDSDQPVEIYSLIRNFAILRYVPQYPMILYADSKGPDQAVRMRRLIWVFAVGICPKTRLYMTRPN